MIVNVVDLGRKDMIATKGADGLRFLVILAVPLCLKTGGGQQGMLRPV